MAKSDVDKVLMRDIGITVENDYQFYRSRLLPWANNAARRMRKGTFNKTKFRGGLERNLAKPAQEAYYRMNRMGRPPVLSMANKKLIIKELEPGILEQARGFAKE